MPLDDDRFHDECGVFGLYEHPEAANLTYLGLYALQHRGQESAGICTSNGRELKLERQMGLVAEVFNEENLQALKGPMAIGHVRYSTAGSSMVGNAQPIMISCHRGQIALCHNGNLVNAFQIRDDLEKQGAIFMSTSDSEVVLHLIARSREETMERAIIDALSQVKGAYSLLFMTRDKMIAVRDPHGFRPLVMGRLGQSTVFASETTALDLIDADLLRELAPGEMVVVDNQGVEASFPFPRREPKFCVFEHVYFARPDSTIFDRNVDFSRHRLGETLAKEHPVDADMVIPVPDSGVYAALGYSKQSGIPVKFALVRNHYVGRTFIEPKQSIRHFGVKIKLNPVRGLIEGRRVILVDDSIVRGTTSRKIIKMVRKAGAREVHLMISSPPIVSPCYYGIDTPTRRELIASSHTVQEIENYLSVDSLGYLSIEGMLQSVGAEEGGAPFCTSCFTGDYPIEPPRDHLDETTLIENKVKR
jgi:amidophosphoribosyltransferase